MSTGSSWCREFQSCDACNGSCDAWNRFCGAWNGSGGVSGRWWTCDAREGGRREHGRRRYDAHSLESRKRLQSPRRTRSSRMQDNPVIPRLLCILEETECGGIADAVVVALLVKNGVVHVSVLEQTPACLGRKGIGCERY